MKLEDQELRYKNPNTTSDLVIPVSLEAVLTHEQRLSNFNANCAHDIHWLNAQSEKPGTAIVCGAAPSLNHNIKEIAESGACIFACNTGAKVLAAHGVTADFQVLLDPQELVINEFCDTAKTHLLASIVDPKLIGMAKTPVLWHPDFPWMWDALKDSDKEFCYIGGGVSVGTYAVSIAYTMGYRDIKIYGMDSSFINGVTHANGWHVDNEGDGRIKVHVEFNGNNYQTTYDMKQQVLVFLRLADLLEQAGCKIDVIGEGLLPDVWADRKKPSKIGFAETAPASA